MDLVHDIRGDHENHFGHRLQLNDVPQYDQHLILKNKNTSRTYYLLNGFFKVDETVLFPTNHHFITSLVELLPDNEGKDTQTEQCNQIQRIQNK